MGGPFSKGSQSAGHNPNAHFRQSTQATGSYMCPPLPLGYRHWGGWCLTRSPMTQQCLIQSRAPKHLLNGTGESQNEPCGTAASRAAFPCPHPLEPEGVSEFL